MSGMAIKLSKFQDQPASFITESRHKPLSKSTPRLNNISRQRRNASHRDSSTRRIIGASTFHILALTREKMASPSNSQPETQTCSRGNWAWSAELQLVGRASRLPAWASRPRSLFEGRDAPVAGETPAPLAFGGFKSPNAK